MVIRQACLMVLVLFAIPSSFVGCDNGGGSTPPQSLSSPARVSAVGPDSLVVTDYIENKFCLIDKASLAVTSCFSTKGQPTGVAYADYDGGRYFVGNKSVRSVDIFDARGNFLGHVGGKIALFGQVNDLSVDAVDQQLYVLDSLKKEVRIFELDGNDTGISFGGSVLKNPTALAAIPGNGGVLVSDFGDPASIVDSCPQIRFFDSNENLDSSLAIVGNMGGGMFGGCGTGQFSAPQGLTIDASNNVFVVDALTSKVLIFNLLTSRDVPLKTLGVRGVEDGELFYPLDVSVDAVTKDVFVADNRNGRVTVFSGGGELP